MAIEYRVLGPIEAVDDGKQVSLGGKRQRGVLALLLLHANEVIPASRLIDDVWAEDPPETATNILQGYVSDLRRTLGREAIATRGRGYAIHLESGDLDLRRFERLADAGVEALDDERPDEAAEILSRALGLWRGPALADVADEPFMSLAAARLEELRFTVLEKRIDADLACGRHGEVVAELSSLVAEHPLREWFRAQHMLALYRSGRQAEALDSYQAGRRILADELGIDPGPALQRLEQAILSHDPTLELTVAGRDEFERPLPPRIVLVVSVGGSPLTDTSSLGAILVRQPGYELVLAGLVASDHDLGGESARLSEMQGAVSARGAVVRAAAFTSSDAGGDVVGLASEQDVALMLFEAPASLLDDGMPDPTLAFVLAQTPCDVAVLVSRGHQTDGPVVVPFGGVEHDWAAVELGAWLAMARSVPLRLVGATAVPERGKRDASRLLFHASLAVQRAVGVAAEPVLKPPGTGGVLEASEGAGLLVVGLSDRWHKEGLGAVRLELARDAEPPTLLVRRGPRPGGLAPRERLTRFTWSVAPPVS